jgi:undecaprenyl-diphosphatase
MNRRRIWFVLAPVILFAMLAICIQVAIVTRFEGWAYGEAVEDMSPNLTLAMKGITHLGDSVLIFVFSLVLFLVPKTRKEMALPVSMAAISSAVLNIILKHIFARSRPDILQLISETGYSFPSGHAMNSAALYTVLILLIWRHVKNMPLKDHTVRNFRCAYSPDRIQPVYLGYIMPGMFWAAGCLDLHCRCSSISYGIKDYQIRV